jgi:pimeloyl-ACP methyl ester carboxylesterase
VHPAEDPTTRFLSRPRGRIAYDVRGEGHLVVCVPGMGELRSSYRFLTPALVEAGYRVATMDLRGHGDSDTTFDTYDDVAAGSDVVALIEELGVVAAVVGNSMGAGAAAWAAAEAPGRVAGLILIGPFVRQVPVGKLMELGFKLAMMRPWGRAGLAWLVPEALPWPQATRFRGAPRQDPPQPEAAGTLEGLRRDDPHVARTGGGSVGGRASPDVGDHGRERPGLPRPGGGSTDGGRAAACRGRHGA